MSDSDSTPSFLGGLWHAINWSSPRPWAIFILGSLGIGFLIGLIIITAVGAYFLWQGEFEDSWQDAFFIVLVAGACIVPFRLAARKLTPQDKDWESYDISMVGLENRNDHFLNLIWILLSATSTSLPVLVLGRVFQLPHSPTAFAALAAVFVGMTVSGRFLGVLLHRYRMPLKPKT